MSIPVEDPVVPRHRTGRYVQPRGGHMPLRFLEVVEVFTGIEVLTEDKPASRSPVPKLTTYHAGIDKIVGLGRNCTGKSGVYSRGRLSVYPRSRGYAHKT